MPVTWHPEHLQDTLSEDDLVEAWLLMLVRVGVHVNRTTTQLPPSLKQGSNIDRPRTPDFTTGVCAAARNTTTSLDAWEHLWETPDK